VFKYVQGLFGEEISTYVDHSNDSDEHGRQVGKVVCVDAGCLEVRMIWETDYVKCFRGWNHQPASRLLCVTQKH
jgi:hypothetical protein